MARSIAGHWIATALVSASIVLVFPLEVWAASWGDASLRSVDTRLTLDRRGTARVQLVVGIKVTARRLRALAVDAVDAQVQPLPADGVGEVLTDGPGWAAQVLGGHGEARSALVEPLLGPGTQNRLRIRFDSLEPEGLPRGDHTITLAYGLDLVARGMLRRERSSATLTWAPPRWSEGHDSASLTIALPAAQGTPQILLVDPDGHERTVDGFGVVTLRRTSELDELTVMRPRVPHDDDTRWLVRFDARGLSAVAAAPVVASATSVGTSGASTPWWLAGLGAFGVAGAMSLRDRQVRREASRLESEFRPLLPLPDLVRAGLAAVMLLACFSLAATGRMVGASFMCVGAMAAACVLASRPRVSTQRATESVPSSKKRGRWLTLPGPPSLNVERRASWLEPRGRRGLGILFCVAAVVIASGAYLATVRSAWRGCFFLCAPVLVPLLLTGRADQLRPSRRSRVRLLGSIARVLRASPSVDSVAWLASLEEGDLRLRIVPSERARASASSHRPFVIDIGCRSIHGLGTIVLAPEIVFQSISSFNHEQVDNLPSDATARGGSAGEVADDSSSFSPCPAEAAPKVLSVAEAGVRHRTAHRHEVFSVRPADVSPRGVCRAVETLLQGVAEPPRFSEEQRVSEHSPTPPTRTVSPQPATQL